MGDTREVDGDPIAGPERLHRPTEGLQPPHARQPPARRRPHELDLVVDGEAAAGQRAGDDGPGAADGEDDRSTQRRARPLSVAAGVAATRRSRASRSSPSPTPVGASTGTIDGAGERRAGEPVRDVEPRQLGRVVVDESDLRERHDTVTDAEQLEDPEVLLGLRLPSLGGGHDEEAGVHCADAGEHVGQEPDVPGHVDEADALARRQGRRSEPEVDRQAAPLLLVPAVGVGAGEGLDEGRLAVVDVTGGGDDPQCQSFGGAGGRGRNRPPAGARPARGSP